MCTAVILRRPGHAWPLIFAANRDEMADRPWRPPARHWPDRPEVTAGLDSLSGGSWLGVNDHGVLAGVLNRYGSLGPQEGKRSRGELVLEALDHADAAEAARALAHIDPAAYRTFNLVIADDRDAFWLANREDDGARPIEVADIPEGLSMLTARDLNDDASPRIRAHLEAFRQADQPRPDAEDERGGDWGRWPEMLARRDGRPGDGWEAGMTVVSGSGFETVSSSLLALPDRSAPAGATGEPPKPVWLFAPGRPDRHDYRRVDLNGGL
ncbi:MAG: NRDE family protein [Rhodovibrionaceae bacterium]|nr:NRDE family protein [Rhodovibrionaceae bacterium]